MCLFMLHKKHSYIKLQKKNISIYIAGSGCTTSTGEQKKKMEQLIKNENDFRGWPIL